MMDLVKDLDDANCWAVGRFDALVNQAKLPEGIMDQIPSVRWFSASGHINGGLRGAIRAEARDEQAAQNLRDVVQGFLALAKMQTGSKPELQALDELSPALRRRQDREPPLRGAGQGPRHRHEREEERGIDFGRLQLDEDNRHLDFGISGIEKSFESQNPGVFFVAIYQNPAMTRRVWPHHIGALVCAALIFTTGTRATGAPDRDPRVEALLAAVSADRLAATVKTLAAFGTRQLYSDTTSPTRGIGAAREWIRQQFIDASPRFEVAFDTYQVAAQGGRLPRDVELRNVVAILPGQVAAAALRHGPLRQRRAPHRRHRRPAGSGFDWTRADNDAPGANDDGSGTALVIELARAVGASNVDFDATIVFVAFAGEEEGLVGSTLHAGRAAAEHWPIDAVLNNDIVGGSHGGDGIVDTAHVRVFSEGPEDSASRALARYVRRAAGRYVPEQEVCWPRARIGSGAAATTRRSTRRASRPCVSRKRARTTRGSTACSTRRKASTPATFNGTPG